MKRYKLVTTDKETGKMFPELFAAEEFRACFEARGYVATGTVGGPPLREELRGEPQFRDLCGPMWDGEAEGFQIVRYECWKTYQTLST
jgi:hypothetical protein